MKSTTRIVPAFTALTALMFLASCTSSQPDAAPAVAESQNDNMNSVLWMQTSAEYKGNSIQVFQNASSRLEALLSNRGISADINQASAYGCNPGEACEALAQADLKPAVVLDVDETVLDNSPYQARLVSNGTSFNPATWDAWVAERAAIAIPGAISFIEAARAEGAAVIYITNRACAMRPGNDDTCPQKTDTAANLRLAGFPEPGDDDLLILRGEKPAWDFSEKQSRREHIAQKYRIMMLIGDDLGDLASGIKGQSLSARSDFVDSHQALYGQVWFQLTNPTYGSWARALGSEKKGGLRIK